MIAKKIAGQNWKQITTDINNLGYAVTSNILDDKTCQKLITSYEDEKLFRKTIKMSQYNFGQGEYKYLSYPLPAIVSELREGLYTYLAPIVNEWSEKLVGWPAFPPKYNLFLKECKNANQLRPTPLILKYKSGDYNCLHQDLYGDVYFPLQVAFLLNEPRIDFTGGEFIMTEQRPRMQSRGHVIDISKGAAVIFTTNTRPQKGTRGYYRVTMRHGVSTVMSGMRHTLGIIFHDAS